MKKLLATLLIALGLSATIVGCQATIKGGELSSYLNDFKKNQATEITVLPDGIRIKTNVTQVATTQRSATTQASITGPADALKNFKLGEASLDTLSSVSAEFQKAPVRSILLTLVLLGGAVLAWLLGNRLVAVGLGGLLIVSWLAPEIMIYGALVAIAGVAFIAYRKYVSSSKTILDVSQQHSQVVKSIASAIDAWFDDPAQKADFKTYLKAGQDLKTQGTVQQILHAPEIANLAGHI
jgi:hypothetical protein